MRKLFFILIAIIATTTVHAQQKKFMLKDGIVQLMYVYDSAAVKTANNLKLNISDTASMLLAYHAAILLKVKYTDTAAILANYATAIGLRVKYSDTASMLAAYLTAINLKADKATTLTINGTGYDLSANRTWNIGTVTNIATGLGLSGGPITGTGTILLDTADASVLSRQRAANTYLPLAGGTLTGPLSGTSLTASSLTSGRIPYSTTAGLLTDNANLTWADGATIKATNYPLTLMPVTNNAGSVIQMFSSNAVLYTGINNTAGTYAFTGGLPYSGLIGTGAAYPLQFGTNSSIKLTIESGGDIGVGTTNPTSPLEIYTATTGSKDVFKISTATHNIAGFLFNTNGYYSTLSGHILSIASTQGTAPSIFLGTAATTFNFASGSSNKVSFLNASTYFSQNVGWEYTSPTAATYTAFVPNTSYLGGYNYGMGFTTYDHRAANGSTNVLNLSPSKEVWVGDQATDTKYSFWVNRSLKGYGYASITSGSPTFTTDNGMDLRETLNPGEQITIGGNTYTVLSVNSSSQATFTTNASTTSTNVAYTFPSSASRFGVKKNGGIIVKSAVGQANNLQEWQNSSGTALNVVDPNGNVGIGNTAPTAKLSIGTAFAPFVGTALTLSNGAGNAVYAQISRDGSDGLFFGRAASYSWIVTNGYSDALRLDASAIHLQGTNTSGAVGIGTTSIAASSLLDLTSTTKGLLIPRMTTAQRDAISSPAAWLTILCTDCTATDGSTGVMQVYNLGITTWKNAW